MNTVGRTVTGSDLDALYARIKGSPSSNSLIDAKEALARHDYKQAIELVGTTKGLFETSHHKLLRDAARPTPGGPELSGKQAERRKQRQEKCQHTLAQFDEVLAALQRMMDWQHSIQESTDTSEYPAGFQTSFERAPGSEAQTQVVEQFYCREQITTADDIQTGAIYFVTTVDRNYLVVASVKPNHPDEVSLRAAFSGKRLKSLSKQRFLELGAASRLFRLAPRPPTSQTPSEPADVESSAKSQEASREVLGMGAFSQLADAARRCGLVPNADTIAHVRDREFRLGKYQQASQIIEGLYSKFAAAASQRTQRLRREDIDIASGRKKISPKELLAKRARDRAETQKIERTRNYFMRVMEGLRILMRP